MRNRTYGGVRGRKTKEGEKLLRFPPTRFYILIAVNRTLIDSLIFILHLLADQVADIGKTTRTTSTTYNYASPGQHATRDTTLLQGKQRTTSRSLELPCFGDQGADATDGYSVALQRWA